jgi:hypothetical protein
VAAIELHPVELELGIVEKVEHGERHTLVIRSAVHMEVALTSVQPRQWIPDAVEFGKFEFLGGG